MSMIINFVVWMLIMCALIYPSYIFVIIGKNSDITEEGLQNSDGLLSKIFYIIFNLNFPFIVKLLIFIGVIIYSFLFVVIFLYGFLGFVFSDGGISGFLGYWIEGVIGFLSI